VRRLTDPQHHLAHHEHAARGEVVHAQIEVDVELITGQRHPLGPARNQLGDPRVHHRDLPVRVSRPVWRGAAAAGEPVIPFQPVAGVQRGLGRQLPLADHGTADDQDDPAAIAGRLADPVEPGLQTLARRMLHILILAGAGLRAND
jgi:hypothetical protein